MVNNIFTLYIKPTEMCNLKCKYCYIPEEKREKNKLRMTLEDVNYIIEKAKKELLSSGKNEKLVVVFHGGEPFLMGVDFYKEIYKKWGVDNQIDFRIVTNLTLYDKKWDFIIERLFKGCISTSFDLTRQTFNGYDDFYRMWIKKYVEANTKFSVSLMLTVSKPFVEYHPSFWVKILKSLSPKGNIKFNYYIETQSNRCKDELRIELDTYISYLIELIKLWINSGESVTKITKLGEFLGIHQNEFNKIFCGTNLCLMNHLVINPDGTVGVCPAMTGNGLVFGNVFNKSFNDFLLSSERLKLISSFISTPEECLNCEHVTYCGYGCPAILMNGVFKRGKKCRDFLCFLKELRDLKLKEFEFRGLIEERFIEERFKYVFRESI